MEGATFSSVCRYTNFPVCEGRLYTEYDIPPVIEWKPKWHDVSVISLGNTMNKSYVLLHNHPVHILSLSIISNSPCMIITADIVVFSS